MRAVGVLVIVSVLAGCRVNFDPASFDTCELARDAGVAAFRWEGNDHCYSLHTTASGTLLAQMACTAIDAHRVTYQSRDEMDAVLANLAPSVPTWLGAQNNGGGIQWDTGEPPVFGNWNAGEPSGTFGQAVMDPDGGWRTVGQAPYAFICERAAIVTSDRVYTLETEGKRWDLHRDSCDLRGAHLATITSSAEALLLEPFLYSVLWLGATAEVGTTDFAWITGEPFSYNVWSNGQPDLGDEYCLETKPGGWNNNNCNSQLAAICEYQ
jgi:hypothetical protein